eukprot:TRINITY_DN2469_c0_g1_i2.p1 TRINITY_DN2469_c0_g1~~TRINITY_DN2469_c0_g1_i2.p1  ORF type:complete len:791 (+),score=270.97 TRINITY_DN2469_c0_g1_i2:221-2593(+)
MSKPTLQTLTVEATSSFRNFLDCVLKEATYSAFEDYRNDLDRFANNLSNQLQRLTVAATKENNGMHKDAINNITDSMNSMVREAKQIAVRGEYLNEAAKEGLKKKSADAVCMIKIVLADLKNNTATSSATSLPLPSSTSPTPASASASASTNTPASSTSSEPRINYAAGSGGGTLKRYGAATTTTTNGTNTAAIKKQFQSSSSPSSPTSTPTSTSHFTSSSDSSNTAASSSSGAGTGVLNKKNFLSSSSTAPFASKIQATPTPVSSVASVSVSSGPAVVSAKAVTAPLHDGTVVHAEKDAKNSVKILIDGKVDKALSGLVDSAKIQLDSVQDLKTRASILALFVCSSMGGAARDEEFKKACAKKITKAHKLNGDRPVPLGSLTHGMAYHRSLLFKYIADAVNLPTKLVAPYYSFAPPMESATALSKNTVFTQIYADDQWFVVDLMRDAGRLFLANGKDGEDFKTAMVAWVDCPLVAEKVQQPPTSPRTAGAPAKPNPADVKKAAPGKVMRHMILPDQDAEIVLNERLGKGMYGDVYRCRVGGYSCAVKVVNIKGMNDTALRMMYNEISLLESLHHENIVKFLGCEEVPRREIKIFMEFLPCSLTSLISKRKETLSYFHKRDVVKVAKAIAKALSYLHGRKIVHRDIKSNNVLVEVDSGLGKIQEVRVCDFGVSKVLQEGSDMATFAGTNLWVAPEIFDVHFGVASSYDEKCDVWSFAMVLVEMVTLNPPYSKITAQQATTNIRNGIPPSLECEGSVVDEKLEALILACLKKNPADRIPFDRVLNLLNDMS